jgi:preprotein translocase subunit SecE
MVKSIAAQIMDEDSIGGKIKSWPQRVKGFYTEVRTETKKVTAPSWKEVKGTTVVVIVTVFVFAAYFYVVDLVLSFGLDRLFKYFR